MNYSGMKFGEYLLYNKYITNEELSAAIKLQNRWRSTNYKYTQLGNILITNNIMSEEMVCQALTRYMKDVKGLEVEFYSTGLVSINSDMANLLRIEDIRSKECVPVSFSKAEDKCVIGFLYKPEVNSRAGVFQYIKNILVNRYPSLDVECVYIIENSYIEIESDISVILGLTPLESKHVATIQDSLLQIFRVAIQKGASDISIEQGLSKTRIWLRINSTREELTSVKLPYENRDELVNCIMRSTNTSEVTYTSMGYIDISLPDLINDGRWTGRCNIQETINGANITIRLIKKAATLPDFNDLNLYSPVRKYLIKASRLRGGIIVIGGGQGSGKSTNVYAMLTLNNPRERKVISCEEPVEKFIDGITQIPIDESQKDKGRTFARVAGSAMRQDANVLFIGEMRDNASAEQAIKLGTAGVLVYTTLHYERVGEIFPRMQGLAPAYYTQFISSLKCATSQKMLQRLCPYCRRLISFNELDDIQKEIISKQKFKGKPYKGNLFQPRRTTDKHCPFCNDKGYKGVDVIMEYVHMDYNFKTQLYNCSDAVQITQERVEQQGTSFRYNGLIDLHLGITSVDELTRLAVLGGD